MAIAALPLYLFLCMPVAVPLAHGLTTTLPHSTTSDGVLTVEPEVEVDGNQTLARLLDAATPHIKQLDPLLQQALQASNLTQVSPDLSRQLTKTWTIIIDAGLYVPPPVRPDEEARRLGLTGESFMVTTGDGYILEEFRVRRGECAAHKAVVVVPHTIMANAAVFMLLGTDSLVYRLARECYDVYLLSFRGSVFGRRHKTLTDHSAEFWDFDPFQLATDLAAGLEFVYTRHNTRVRLVGADMGATTFFIMNAFLEPRYQHMVASSYWYAPTAYIGHMVPGPFATMALLRKVWKIMAPLSVNGELAFWDPKIHGTLYNLCGRIAPRTCSYVVQLLAGPGTLRVSRFRYFFRNVLDSVSIRTIAYYMQHMYRARYFRLYDYGKSKNVQLYGSEAPPVVPLNATITPCTFFALGNAAVMVTEDVRQVFKDLAPSAQSRLLVLKGYNSVGPVMPLRADGIYNPLLQRIAEDLTVNQTETTATTSEVTTGASTSTTPEGVQTSALSTVTTPVTTASVTSLPVTSQPSTSRATSTRLSTTRMMTTRLATTRTSSLRPLTTRSVTTPSSTTRSVTPAPVTNPSVTHPSVTHPSVAHPSVTHPSVTHPSVTHQSVTHPSVIHPSVTHPSMTHPSVTHPPGTHQSGTHTSVTHSSATTRSANTSLATTLMAASLSVTAPLVISPTPAELSASDYSIDDFLVDD